MWVSVKDGSGDLHQQCCASWSHVLMQPSGLSDSEWHRVPLPDLRVRRGDRKVGGTQEVCWETEKETSNRQIQSDRSASEQEFDLTAWLFGEWDDGSRFLMLPRWKAVPPVYVVTVAYNINTAAHAYTVRWWCLDTQIWCVRLQIQCGQSFLKICFKKLWNVICLQSEQSLHLTEEKGHLGLCVRLTVLGIIESHVLKFTAKGSPLHLSPS